MCNCQTEHERYVARINKLVEKSGEGRTLDGLSSKKNSVQIAHEMAMLRRYG